MYWLLTTIAVVVMILGAILGAASFRTPRRNRQFVWAVGSVALALLFAMMLGETQRVLQALRLRTAHGLVFGVIVMTDIHPPERSRVTALLCRLGDASYALYLFHPLVVVVTRKIYVAFGLPQPFGFWPLVLADLPIAGLMSLVVHAMIEMPIHDKLGAWFRTYRADRRRDDLDRSIPSTSWK